MRRALFTLLTIFSALGVGGLLSADETMTIEGGSVASGPQKFQLSAVSGLTGTVTGTAAYEDTRDTHGLNTVSATLYIRIMDELTGMVLDVENSASPSISGNEVTWSFSATIPAGQKFYGCKIAGSYTRIGGGSYLLDSSLGAWADF